jgi:TonB family protein
MRSIATSVFVVLLLSACSAVPEQPVEAGPALTVVVAQEAAGRLQGDLCGKAREWVEVEMRYAGILMGRGKTDATQVDARSQLLYPSDKGMLKIESSLAIRCWDHRFEATFRSFTVHSASGSYVLPPDMRPGSIAWDTAARARDIAADLTAYVVGDDGAMLSAVPPSAASAATCVKEQPKALYPIPPVLYPKASVAAKESGELLVQFLVLENGKTHGVSVARSSGFERLDKVGVDRLRHTRYKPAIGCNGAVTRAAMTERIVFDLER